MATPSLNKPGTRKPVKNRKKQAGKFEKGESGNPGGRPPGAPNKATRTFREAMMAAFDDLGGSKHLLTWARANSTDYYRIVARLIPPGAPANIGPLTGTLTEKTDTILAKMAEGAITPEQAQTFMQVLGGQAQILKVDDLERRIKSIEERQNGQH